ncbi:hypothetical protein V6R86_04175 [Sphingomonas kaistensis]|uniref:Uncharacterized protein n=1 Tax=Sphingomonas kaistensis TaxID=298708 RepID=A0ABZ2G246_9SPHN
MREPKDFQQTAPTLRTFTLNSDYAHWLTREEQEESMLPRVARPECLNGRVARMPPGVEGVNGSVSGHGEPRRPRRRI